jgi:phage FluMu gp28-like protein
MAWYMVKKAEENGELKNGSKIKAFSASPDATRSQAASLVIFDEMAFTPNCCIVI